MIKVQPAVCAIDEGKCIMGKRLGRGFREEIALSRPEKENLLQKRKRRALWDVECSSIKGLQLISHSVQLTQLINENLEWHIHKMS